MTPGSTSGNRESVSQPSGEIATWRKSSLCDTNTCLEISRSNGLLWLRNSTRPAVTVSFTAQEWRSFRDGLIRGEFDDLEPGTTNSS
jgi:hypothetical protein